MLHCKLQKNCTVIYIKFSIYSENVEQKRIQKKRRTRYTPKILKWQYSEILSCFPIIFLVFSRWNLHTETLIIIIIIIITLTVTISITAILKIVFDWFNIFIIQSIFISTFSSSTFFLSAFPIHTKFSFFRGYDHRYFHWYMHTLKNATDLY